MFFAPFEDLTFLEATQDGHDVHRLFVVGLAGGVDALLSDPNHRLLRRDFSGSDRSGSDDLFFARWNDQAMPSAIRILDPSSTDL